MGEDTCLFEEESGSEESQSEFGEGHADPEVCRNVDFMVERITEGLEKDVGTDFQDQSAAEMAGKPEDYQSVEGEIENEGARLGDTISPVSGYEEFPSGLQGESDDRAL
ncbi:hypothetical protein A2U01_0065230, partial [Trifolium medium]|nr:hypothetical protein [Trifolium medium]